MTTGLMQPGLDIGSTPTQDVDITYRKITLRLIPLLFICYVMNYIDRANIGYAQLQMKPSLGFSDTVYGLAAGVFFIGYFLFELPSNMLLRRIGARKTILRIMLGWGLVSAATMFVSTPLQFYVARFLLGVFEAGFLPGIMLYLTFWYPAQRRARVIALFMSATVVASILTGPVSGWILQNMHGVNGWEGWQWMFLLEGLPSAALGIVAWLYLPNNPSDARWLTSHEKQTVQHGLRQSSEDALPAVRHSLRQAFLDPKVYLLCFALFAILCGGYFLSFWTPSLIKELGVTSPQQIGLYAAIPSIIAAVVMVFYGRHSDARQERRWHFAVAAFAAAMGLLAITVARSDLGLLLAALTLTSVGVVSALPIFYAIATAHLSREAAPAGLSIITSLASLAGVVSPALIGAIKTRTGSADSGLYVFGALLVIGAIALLIGMRQEPGHPITHGKSE
ncbi:MFS transporter [Variovorax robiniae]|uniref:MFS transporter n=1 Tax=Variovorax robiniae TaxID=1836199 RepID=A0ABU8X5X7_9BURK